MDGKDAKFIPATPEQIKRARDQYETDDVEIDDNAGISPSDDGVWVQAWVWLASDKEA